MTKYLRNMMRRVFDTFVGVGADASGFWHDHMNIASKYDRK